MARKRTKKDAQLNTVNSIKSDDVLAVCTPSSGPTVSISLTSEDREEIKKLERYAVLAARRVGEFSVG